MSKPRQPGTLNTRATSALSAFRRDEDGAAMIWNLFWAFSFLMIGGLCVDASNAWRLRAQLQVTADAAALAAATQGIDENAGRPLALSTALRNMPQGAHGDVLNPVDVVYGVWESATDSFVPDADPTDSIDPDAIQVTVRRATENNNEAGTFLLDIVGVDHWDIKAISIAAMRSGGPVTCAGATVITTNFLDTGGGNDMRDGVCLYGQLGVRTGGGDFIEDGVRIGAADKADVTINALAPGSAEEEDIVFGGTLGPVILPQLNSMYSDLMAAVGNPLVTTYSGDLLPEFVFDGDGNADVVHVTDDPWIIHPAGHSSNIVEIEPNTIYVASGSVQFSGSVDASKIALIANGQIQIGSGSGLQFDEIFMFGTGQLNFGGDVLWGDPTAFCGDGIYRAYLFSQASLFLGGYAPTGGAFGVIGAAPMFNPGGAMRNAGGLYIEASQYTSLGGSMNIQGCNEALSGDLALTGFPDDGGGSYLVR
ncbi:MAG: pilus assembly protein TadG-related protein [Pseudomonadota bacterium]